MYEYVTLANAIGAASVYRFCIQWMTLCYNKSGQMRQVDGRTRCCTFTSPRLPDYTGLS